MSVNLRDEFKDIKFDSPDKMVVKGSMMPFNGSNSGSRKLMFGTHLEQRLALCSPDVPYITTGHENEFGIHSSSIEIADTDYYVYDKIFKYEAVPNHHFYMICIDDEHKKICIFEKKSYKHITESYGYLYCNKTAINLVEPGCYITKGSPIMKSTAFDEYNNRMDGKNLLSMFSSCEENMEDAIIMSESAARSLTSPLIKKVYIYINDNDIPLNIYGDQNTFKILPDIGEEIVNGILCATRVERKEESLYSLSYDKLREIMMSDEKYTLSGTVVDIDVYCNNTANLIDNPYYGQILMYHQSQMNMYKKLVDDIDINLKEYFDRGYKLDFKAQEIYSKAKGALNGKQYYSNGKVFSNILIEVAVIEEIPISRGDKITNRYGGKGISSRIKPDNLMPRTSDGRRIDVLLNLCGVA